MISSCYQCKDRQIGCHSSCERYLEEKKIHDAKQKEITKRKAESSALRTDVINGIKRMKKSKR